MDPLPPPEPQDAAQDATGRRYLEDLRAALGGDFEVLRAIGRGSVSSVFLAQDRALGVLVAIKVLRPDKVTDETTRRRFEREARAAASLADHPNTVAVTRFGRLPDETPYLVMQYVKGRTVEERIKAEGRLAVDAAARILGEVASALAAAHAKGIIHRGVQPANVLWDEERGCSRLTDFGIAAVLSASGADSTRLTKTGQLLGDPRYLSPEQLLDTDLTELTDMYLFGVLGYELLTGKGPFEARSPTEWITAHIKKEPRDVRELRADVPQHLADLLRRCLAKNPLHRPSARDVERALRDGAAPPRAGTVSGAQDHGDLNTLIRKRVPQIVLGAVAGGWALMTVMDQLVDREVLPLVVYRLTLPFAVAGVLTATVIAWFHGEKGRQRAPFIEYVLIALIAVAWILVSVFWSIRGQTG